MLSIETQDAHSDEPREGDTVHIAGHGPGLLTDVNPASRRGAKRYKVQYPNGDEYHVSREQISYHEPARGPSGSSGPVAMSMSPRQVAPRQVEYLGRSFNDPARSMAAPSAIFSLVATMVGGGVLSLPYAMSQCGLVLGTLSLFLAGAATFWTLEMLVECARSTGRDTFELVGHVAFGEGSRKATIALVFVICWLSQIAYFVLLGDLLVPMAELSPRLQQMDASSLRKGVLTLAALLLSPMCFKSSLSVLRFLCFASVGSVLFVGVVIAIRSVDTMGSSHDVQVTWKDDQVQCAVGTHYDLWPKDWVRALYVFPMFGVSFLCHFNALPTHQELQRPTRGRIRRVLALTLTFTAFLYLAVGVFGYLYAGSCTCGNILLNFSGDDKLVLASRVMLGCVLMLNFPLLVQPCRNALYRMLLFAGMIRQPEAGAEECEQASALPEADGSGESGETAFSLQVCDEASASTSDSGAAAGAEAGQVAPAAAQARSPDRAKRRSPSPAVRVHVYTRQSTRGFRSRSDPPLLAFDSFAPKDETVQQSAVEPTTAQRYLLTVLLLVTALAVACFMKSILVVWSVLGSTVAFAIAFILPASFWLKIVGPSTRPLKRRAGVVLLAISIVLAIACTVLTCFHLSEPPCPNPHTLGSHAPTANAWSQAKLEVTSMYAHLIM